MGLRKLTAMRISLTIVALNVQMFMIFSSKELLSLTFTVQYIVVNIFYHKENNISVNFIFNIYNFDVCFN